MNTLAQLTGTQLNYVIIIITIITAIFIWLIVGTVEYNAGMHNKSRRPKKKTLETKDGTPERDTQHDTSKNPATLK